MDFPLTPLALFHASPSTLSGTLFFSRICIIHFYFFRILLNCDICHSFDFIMYLVFCFSSNTK